MFEIVAEGLRDAEQDVGALARRQVAPALREGLVRAFDGGLDIGGAGGGNFAEHFLGGGIGLRKDATVAATAKFAVDEKLGREAESSAHGVGVAAGRRSSKLKV